MDRVTVRRVLYLLGVSLVVVLIMATAAFAQGTAMETTIVRDETTIVTGRGIERPLAPSGGPALLLPAAALLFGAGILTYAVLRHRS